MIRIAVTDLESFRFWKDSDAPLSDLIARLTKTSPPTPQMEAGRAFAKLMETGSDGLHDVESVDGWLFDFTGLDADLQRAPLREIKAERVYATPHGPVTLVAKADGLNGRTVHDQKLTGRWDAEKYLDSLQWRAYLDLFDADTFVYDVFVGKYESGFAAAKDYDMPVPDDGQIVRVTDYHRMAFFRYPTLGADIERAVRELAGVIADFAPGLVTPDAEQAA